MACNRPKAFRAAIEHLRIQSEFRIPDSLWSALLTDFPVEEKALPSNLRLAGNAAKALIRNARAVFTGKPLLADDVTIESRKAACAGCEFFRASDTRCAHPNCGCHLDGQLLAKWKLLAEYCPLGKWAQK